MTQLSYQIPILGNPSSSEDPKTHDALQQIETVVNGELDAGNMTPGEFLELLTKGSRRRLAFGLPSLVFPGGGPQSNTLTVPHGLGSTPVLVLALVAGGVSDDNYIFALTASADATNIQFRARSVMGGTIAAGSVGMWWVAII